MQSPIPETNKKAKDKPIVRFQNFHEKRLILAICVPKIKIANFVELRFQTTVIWQGLYGSKKYGIFGEGPKFPMPRDSVSRYWLVVTDISFINRWTLTPPQKNSYNGEHKIKFVYTLK